MFSKLLKRNEGDVKTDFTYFGVGIFIFFFTILNILTCTSLWVGQVKIVKITLKLHQRIKHSKHFWGGGSGPDRLIP